MGDTRIDAAGLKALSLSQRLRGYEIRAPEIHPILDASYNEPDAYFQALHDQFVANGYHSQTVIQERYALYWDLIEAKCGHRVPALSVYQEDLNWQNFSYEGLHQRVGEVAANWAAAGITGGTTITLLAPIGFEFLIGLLAGLRLGATISWVSPDGPAYIKHRLEALGSEYIAANARHHSDLPAQRVDFSRAPAGEQRPAPPPVHYQPDAIVLKLLSPLSPRRDTPVELTAADLYHRTLNDVLVVLELNGADRVSIAGLDPSQYQPWALLTTLLAGGTFVHVTPETLASTPHAWNAFQPTVLGLDDQFRKLMLRHQPSLQSSLRLWFRDIAEPLDWQGWQDFQEGFEGHTPWGMNLLVNAAFGGTIFFSPRADRVPPIHVTPAPGLAWSLLDQSGPGETRRRATGLYAAPDSTFTADHLGKLLVSQSKPGELYFIGSRDGISGAKTYPTEEVCNLIKSLPSVSECTVLALDRLMDVPGVPVHLLVFLNRALRPHFTPKEKGQVEAEIRQLIEYQLGKRFVPSSLTLTHAYAEKDEGALDLSWVQGQYYRGVLELKEEISIFSTLSALRTLVDESKEL